MYNEKYVCVSVYQTESLGGRGGGELSSLTGEQIFPKV